MGMNLFYLRSWLPALMDAKAWLIFNGTGVGIYLGIEHRMYVPRTPEEAFNGIDQLCIWETQEFPLLAFCFGANTTWFMMSRSRRFFPGYNFLVTLVCLVWAAVIASDPVAVKMVTLMVPMMIERALRVHS